jgi:hypothetical protein
MKDKRINKTAKDTPNEVDPDLVEIDTNLTIGYEQAMKGEGISSEELKRRLAEKKSHDEVFPGKIRKQKKA